MRRLRRAWGRLVAELRGYEVVVSLHDDDLTDRQRYGRERLFHQ